MNEKQPDEYQAPTVAASDHGQRDAGICDTEKKETGYYLLMHLYGIITGNVNYFDRGLVYENLCPHPTISCADPLK